MRHRSFLSAIGWLVSVGGVLACGRVAQAPVEPVSVADALTFSEDDALTSGPDGSALGADGQASPPVAGAFGGLWVHDSGGKPIGVLVQRGHPSLSANGTNDILRDGAILYSPQEGLFFGVQLSTGKVINPRLGVADQSCAKPVVAGYYTEGDAVSGPAYAFVYNGEWYQVEENKPLALVTCGGTVADGIDGKCAPHSGSCRGFPVKLIKPALPLQFSPPMAVHWVVK